MIENSIGYSLLLRIAQHTMPSIIMDRFHSLSTAYSGFYPSATEDVNKITYTEPHKNNPVLPANVAQDQIGEVEVPKAELLQPPYFPVMKYESTRMPLGGPQQQQSGATNNDTIALTKIEFAVLCFLAGIGAAFTIIHLSNEQHKLP